MTNGVNPLHSGNQAFLDEDYAAAVQAYGEVIAAGGEEEAIARSNRAAAYLKLSKHREALQDASAAVKLKPTEIAFYRKGLASFALEEFETALEAFRRGQQAAVAAADSENKDDPRKYRTWIRKCEAEMEAEETDAGVISSGETEANGEKETTPAPVPTPLPAPASAPTPSRAVATAGSMPMDVATESRSTSAVGVRNRAPVSSAPLHVRTRFQYYQSHERVTVALLEKALKAEDVEVEVTSRRLTVRRRQDLVLLFDKVLYEEIQPDKYRTKFLPSKLEISLLKRMPGDWPELEGKAAAGSAAPPRTAQPVLPVAIEPPSKVARPYSSSKDWDVVERDIKKELDADKPQGEEALNHLFKQIYGNADEDTRRAMIKSFQTSGGTVLSTNWDEVSKADYEQSRQAPKGMEWRTWEGKKLPQKDDDEN